MPDNAYQVPLSQLQHRPDHAPDAVRTVEVRAVLTDKEIAEAFCNRGDRNQAAILNHIAAAFHSYPMQTDFIAMVEGDEALTSDAVLWIESLAQSARASLIERQSAKAKQPQPEATS
jgi:hypothetical protein